MQPMMKLLLYAALAVGFCLNCSIAFANPFSVTYIGETEAGADDTWDLAWQAVWTHAGGERVDYVWFGISDNVTSEDITNVIIPWGGDYLTTPGLDYYVGVADDPYFVPEGAHALLWTLSPRRTNVVVGVSILDAGDIHQMGEVAIGVGGKKLKPNPGDNQFISFGGTGLTPEPGSLAVVAMGFALGGYGLARKKKPRRRYQGRH